MPVTGTLRFASIAGLLALTIGCSKPASKEQTHSVASSQPSAIASVPAVVQSEAAPSLRSPIAREALKPPPLTPPQDALTGAGGVRYQVLRAGTGESPEPLDSLLLDFSMWTPDGQLAFSSFPEPRPAGYSVSSMPPNLRVLLTQLKEGARVRFWAPRAALAGWKPPAWPDSDLIFELELLKVAHVTVNDSAGNAVAPVPNNPPDAAGPPRAALTTESGLRYDYLAQAEKKKLPTASDRLDLVATAYVVEGIEVKLLQSGVKTATTLQRAPGKLSEVLKRLSSGDRVRVWLPQGQGATIIPDAGKRELILDLAVSF